VLCPRCKLRVAEPIGVCATCDAEIKENVMKSLFREENEKEERKKEWERRRKS
jgi:hypothetical protein